jgi:hypothetical protein
LILVAHAVHHRKQRLRHSFLIDAKKLSATALSKQSPAQLMLQAT